MIENLPIKSIDFKGLTIEGYSRAAVQSYWRIPQFKIGFDLGGSPWSFMGTQVFFVTHGHLDHLAALPVLVARRRMMKMPPPVIYMPAEIVDHAWRLLKVWQRLDRGRMMCELIGLQPDEQVELSREHVVSAFRTKHTVPSLGYIVWDRRKKLKAEYQGLPGEKIREIRLSGEDVSDTVLFPLLACTGDTAPDGLDTCEAAYEATVLITEMTFYRPEHRREKIHKFGHIHLDDIAARADRFKNELIILAHFSARYHEQQLQRAIDKRLPESLRSRVMAWL